MSKKAQALLGAAAGAIWAVVLIWIGTTLDIPPFSRVLIEPYFMLAPGLVLVLMILAVILRRFLSDSLIDGAPPPSGSAADIDVRVVRNTVEHAVLALCLWPSLSFLWTDDGLGLVMALSVGFALARLVYWLGYHVSRPLRVFGFAATFFPTLFAVLWGLIVKFPAFIGGLSG